MALPNVIVKERKPSSATRLFARSNGAKPVVETPSYGTVEKDGQYYIADNGSVYRRSFKHSDALVLAPENVPVEEKRKSADNRDKRERLMRMKLLIQMRDQVRTILRMQEEFPDEAFADKPEPPWAANQRKLKELYDSFHHLFGPINKIEYQKTGEHDSNGERTYFTVRPNLKKFRKDPDAYLVASIENFDELSGEATLGPVFTQRVLTPRGQIPKVDTSGEALDFCLSEKGRIDPEFIAELLEVEDATAAITELEQQGKVFLDPLTARWVEREEYLSGNIYKQIEAAQEALTKDPRYEGYIKELEMRLPVSLEPEDIDAALGSSWIPPETIEQFAEEVLGISDAKVQYIPQTHKWFVRGNVEDASKAQYEFGTEFTDTVALLRAALNQSEISISKRKDTYGSDVDKELQTTLSEDKMVKIEDTFEAWLWDDKRRAQQLSDIYNRRFNSIVPRKYDGSHMHFPGSTVVHKPRPYQADVAWRNSQSGNTLYAHEVGAGKTFESIWACMEMRRLGKADKACFVVPNHILAQFSRDFMQLYPNAHILVAEEDMFREDGKKFTVPEKMEKFVERARENEWDAVFMPQSFFDQLKVTPRFELQTILDEIREYRDLYTALPEDADADIHNHFQDAYVAKQSKLLQFFDADPYDREAQAKIWADSFEKLLDKDASDGVWDAFLAKKEEVPTPSFEGTGIDYLFVDEGHDYKNLSIESNDRELARNGSARAESLHLKLQYLRQKRPGACLSIMTGTPVSNAVPEIYTMQRFMQPELLKEMGLENFDAWRTMFGDTIDTIEMAPEGGKYRKVSRLAKYKNIPELIRMFHSFADVVLGERLNLKKPKIKGGGPQVVTVPHSRQLEEFFMQLDARADRVRAGAVDPSEDNMLKIIMDGRLATLSPALVGLDPDPDEPGKLETLVENVAQRYFDNKDNVYHNIAGEPDPITGALQMVISDLGVPKGIGEFDVYNGIKRQLIDKGVPPDSIQFIHDHNSDRKKAELFERCKNGQVSVLLGTTQKLGTGTNVQKRLIALHELDAPWRPSDIIQRDGRIDRSGNQHIDLDMEVEILRYVMEDSYDVYLWQTLERKAGFIAQIMRGDYSIRNFDEEDNFTKHCAHIKAVAANDPVLFELAKVDDELAPLARSKMAFDHERQRRRFHQRHLKHELKAMEKEMKAKSATQEIMTEPARGRYPLQLGEKSFQNAFQAGEALKLTLRDLRTESRKKVAKGLDKDPEGAPREAKVSQEIGEVYGLTVTAEATTEVSIREIKTRRGVKLNRDYKYGFVLKISDGEKTQITIPAADIAESSIERGLRKNFERGGGEKSKSFQEFMNASKGGSQVGKVNEAMAETIVNIFRELPARVDELGSALNEKNAEIQTVQDAIDETFGYMSKYKALKSKKTRIEKKLMERTAKEITDPSDITIRSGHEENKPEAP